MMADGSNSCGLDLHLLDLEFHVGSVGWDVVLSQGFRLRMRASVGKVKKS